MWLLYSLEVLLEILNYLIGRGKRQFKPGAYTVYTYLPCPNFLGLPLGMSVEVDKYSSDFLKERRESINVNLLLLSLQQSTFSVHFSLHSRWSIDSIIIKMCHK